MFGLSFRELYLKNVTGNHKEFLKRYLYPV